MTSPDGLVRIGWFGDDIQPWRITAALDPIAEPQWQAVFNDAFPPEIIAAFTGAVARNWGPSTSITDCCNLPHAVLKNASSPCCRLAGSAASKNSSRSSRLRHPTVWRVRKTTPSTSAPAAREAYASGAGRSQHAPTPSSLPDPRTTSSLPWRRWPTRNPSPANGT
ncbi:DUF317 domain-containing protein [Streptomyces cacaoi]